MYIVGLGCARGVLCCVLCIVSGVRHALLVRAVCPVSSIVIVLDSHLVRASYEGRCTSSPKEGNLSIVSPLYIMSCLLHIKTVISVRRHPAHSRMKNQRGHWVCWMSTSGKNGLMSTTHKAVSVPILPTYRNIYTSSVVTKPRHRYYIVMH